MRVTRTWIAVLVAALLAAAPGQAQTRATPPACPPPPCVSPEPTAPAPAPAPSEPAAQEPTLSPEAFAATGGGETFAAANPQIIGDLLGYYTIRTVATGAVSFPATAIVGTTTFGTFITTNVTVSQAATVAVPALARGAFQITENESPMPQDRIFATFNYFHVPIQTAVLSSAVTLNPTIPSGFGPVVVLFPTASGSPPANVLKVTSTQLDVYRETVGFERTLLDDRSLSLGMRLPIFQSASSGAASVDTSSVLVPAATAVGTNNFSQSNLGDLTMIAKYAPLLDRANGNALSTGLALTVPTSQVGVPLPVGTVRDVLLQPYAGFAVTRSRAYLQGFSAVVVPTDARDITLWSNDLSAGYYLYRSNDRGFNAIIPTVEVHLTDPLNHRGIGNGAISMSDICVLTEGVHFGIGRSLLTMGVATPVTGPLPFTIEAVAQLNWRF
jgi:hypothetical protein